MKKLVLGFYFFLFNTSIISQQGWISQTSGTDLDLSSVYFKDQYNGWVVGRSAIYHTTNGGITFLGDETEIPAEFELYQNYPNPFNPKTKIEFDIPVNGFVNLKIYDVLDNEIKTLINELKPAGGYQIEFDGSSLASGIYFYKLQAGGYSEVKKMCLIK